ncbi:MAG: polysaccharide deacetylase family protein [Devosia sp.]
MLDADALANRKIAKWAGREIDLAQPLVFDDHELLLTFDDGPTVSTKDNVETLGKFGLTAVFFMIGHLADQHPEIVRDTLAQGHVVGSHTATHADLRTLSIHAARREIDEGHAALIRASRPAAPAPFFRFPYLRDNAQLRRMVETLGLTIMDIDVDTRDWSRRYAWTNLYRSISRIEEGGRGIVLLHDVPVTRNALPAMLQSLGARGFRFLRPVVGK